MLTAISILVIGIVLGASFPGGGENEAFGASEATRDGFTLLTAKSRDMRVSEETEVVYLLDHHRGMLLVYGLQDMSHRPSIVLLDGGRIEVLFEQGRAIARSRSGTQTSP